MNHAGAAQAASLAFSLKDAGISHLFCGPLPRVVETARYIGEEVGLVPVELEEFNELAMGPWEGLTEEEVAEQFPRDWQTWNTFPATLKLPGRETLAELQQRVLSGVFKAISQSPGARQICVVSHVAVIRVMCLYSEHRSLDEYKKVPVPNATPIMLKIDENRQL